MIKLKKSIKNLEKCANLSSIFFIILDIIKS